jgi:hypothetical protein
VKGNIIEDVRSGNFSWAWNSNIGQYKVKTQPQMVTQQLAGSVKTVRTLCFTRKRKWMVVRWTYTAGFAALIQWKTELVDGVDREGAHYAMHI